MKLLLISPNYPFPQDKGNRIRVNNILQSLIDLGYEVDLISIDERKLDNSFSSREFKPLANFKVNKISATLRMIFAFVKNQSLTTAFYNCPNFRNKILKEIKKNSYNKIFIISSCLYDTIPMTLDNIYWDLIDTDSFKWKTLTQTSNVFKKIIYRREAKLIKNIEKQILSRAKRVFVVSNLEKEKLVNFKIDDFNKIHSLNIFRDIKKRNFNKIENQIIFTGDMSYLPNIIAVKSFIEEILPLVKLEIPQIKLIVAGRTPSLSLINKYYEVTFTGEVKDLYKLVEESSVYILPLKDNIGFPTKILEAFLLETPLVAYSKIKEIFEVQENLPLLFSNNNQEFADNIIKLLKDKSLASDLAQNALKYSNQYFTKERLMKNLKNSITS
mgnify:CR=1 FL=1